jgi:uncharacterized protein
MDREFSRRTLLGATVATGVGLAVAGTVTALHNSGPPPPAGGGASRLGSGYGALVRDPRGRLSLPDGFRYEVLAEQGTTLLESGEPSPSDPDGAAAFPAPDGAGTVLVSNHEIGEKEPYPVPHVEGFVYDSAARGGTTTIEVAADGTRIRQYVSLAGTLRNCAGGRTPWDTWLSCEETDRILAKPHGYVFEVDPFDQEANRDPRPIKALGRFAHEAVVVDPERFVLYLTEDAKRPNGGLYRYTPPPDALPLDKGSLRTLADDAGVLEALHASTMEGRYVRDLSEATELGTTYRAEWVKVPDRDAQQKPVRRQFRDDQVTRARKLEGMWWGDGGAYVVSSYARKADGASTAHDGQVWFLDAEEQTLTLHLRFAATADVDVDPDGPDNITVSPYGGVIIAEDGAGRPHLLGANPDGEVFYLAQSEPAIKGSEFCGPVFSADGTMLFVSLQGPGMTFSVQGPFRQQA